MHDLWVWGGFNLFVLFMLALDLFWFNRKAHTVGVREALGWSAFWIALALMFNAGVYVVKGEEPAQQFLTGYVLEKMLSVDNLFVFLMLFSFFKVPEAYQHKVLFWGIIGALVMRALFIFAGVALIEKFHWTVYVLGAILIISGIKMITEKDKEVDPEKNPLLRWLRKLIPVTSSYMGSAFFVRQDGRWSATPLFVVLIIVESTDIVFAVDSIPAILSITRDPFIVYSSNVFAILGLRALFFALAGIMHMFRYLNYGLAAVLVFVGIKMLLEHHMKISVGWSLVVVSSLLGVSLAASLLNPAPAKEALPDDADESAVE